MFLRKWIPRDRWHGNVNFLVHRPSECGIHNMVTSGVSGWLLVCKESSSIIANMLRVCHVGWNDVHAKFANQLNYC